MRCLTVLLCLDRGGLSTDVASHLPLGSGDRGNQRQSTACAETAPKKPKAKGKLLEEEADGNTGGKRSPPGPWALENPSEKDWAEISAVGKNPLPPSPGSDSQLHR